MHRRLEIDVQIRGMKRRLAVHEECRIFVRNLVSTNPRIGAGMSPEAREKLRCFDYWKLTDN